MCKVRYHRACCLHLQTGSVVQIPILRYYTEEPDNYINACTTLNPINPDLIKEYGKLADERSEP